MEAKVIVVLPAYNEEANIGGLIESIHSTLAEASLRQTIVVVDDGSRDKTAAILEACSTRIPLVVRTHPVNAGLAATIRDGLLLACEIAEDQDVIVTLDADGTHPAGLIPRMVEMIHEGYDVVIASRYERGGRVHGVSLPRRFASWGASWLFWLLFPTRGVRDFTCGFRAYRVAVLKAAVARFGDRFIDQEGFQCMPDIILKLRRMNASFTEAPLVLRYDLKGGESKMRVASTIRKTLVLIVQRRLGL